MCISYSYIHIYIYIHICCIIFITGGCSGRGGAADGGDIILYNKLV